ncbi:MAG: TetR/AcrR family transcriptional regulator [Bacteroidales bacterium]|nr:TetR/AcrR family transcriptional regulator [Bacteroidales bacterium]MBN2749853.1 TetR/AcrR family transcriptional regulator [Bacteroidales bacterium]
MEFSSKKHKDIVSTAKELFWRYGFKRVTIEEVCATAKVSKMTFYKFYPNKLELAKAVFDMVVDDGVEQFKLLMGSDASVSEKMRGMIQMKLEGTNDISREFLADFYANPELGLSTYIEEKTRVAWTDVITVFREGQQKGWFRSDFKPELLLVLAQKAAELVADSKVVALYDKPQDLVLEFTNLITYGIVNHD